MISIHIPNLKALGTIVFKLFHEKDDFCGKKGQLAYVERLAMSLGKRGSRPILYMIIAGIYRYHIY